jgi:hypothetical protein
MPPKSLADRHLEFAERSHLMRWFGERNTRELKALKKAFEASQNAKPKARKEVA